MVVATAALCCYHIIAVAVVERVIDVCLPTCCKQLPAHDVAMPEQRSCGSRLNSGTHAGSVSS